MLLIIARRLSVARIIIAVELQGYDCRRLRRLDEAAEIVSLRQVHMFRR